MPQMRCNRRSQTGTGSIIEFVLCFVLLVALLLVLCNYCALYMRWVSANQMVGKWAYDLSKEKRLSDAFARAKFGESQFRSSIDGMVGVQVVDAKPCLVILGSDESTDVVVCEVGRIPAHCLPDKGNFVYQLRLTVRTIIQPLFPLGIFGNHVAGLTAPYETELRSTALFQNRARDPSTGEFYLNE